MNNKTRLKSIYALIWLIFLFLNVNDPARCNDVLYEEQRDLKIGRVARVDYAKREIGLPDLKQLRVTDITLNAINNRRTKNNIKDIHEGSELLVRYDRSNNIIKEFWILHNSAEKYDLANFIYIQEKRMNSIIQSYSIGEVDNLNIHKGNRVYIIINDQYLSLFSNPDNPDYLGKHRLVIDVKVHPEGGVPESLHAPGRSFAGLEMLSSGPIIYDIEDLGLMEGCKVKITIALQKEQEILSSKELFLKIKTFGITAYGYDTASFVRDSFGKNWKPAPGASVALGFTFFTWKKTNRLAKNFAALWNAVDPRIGLNLTLLDFDEDKNMEYGLGPELSIFKGGISFGTGWNISTKRTKNRYVFIGISFTQILKKIKGESTAEK